LSNGTFQISTFRGNEQVLNALDPQTYNGEIINAGFLNTDNFGKLSGVLGLRGVYVKKLIGTQLDPVGGDDELEKKAFYQV
jgi:hypothetical protein